MSSRRRRATRFTAACTVVGLALALLTLGALVLSRQAAGAATGAITDPAEGAIPAATTVTDAAGVPLAHLSDQYRVPVPPERLSPAMTSAIVAIEDRRFRDHLGFDPVGVARALANNSSGGSRQGASTLTEQYVKNYELYVGADTEEEQREATEPTYTRKIQDILLAIGVDARVEKADILTGYLNLVYFGRGMYGVEAAAQGWFGTSAQRLTVPQAALLAGMVQSPSDYDPVENPQRALERRDVVIAQMREQGMIDDGQAAAASAAPLGVRDDPGPPGQGCVGAGDAGYFCAYLLEYLERAGLPPEQVAAGGYTIRTTLDRRALDELESAVDGQVPPDQRRIANVMSVVEPGRDGHRVVAMAANRPYGVEEGESSLGLPYEPVNLGAGSVYKIFTAASALEQGVLDDADASLEVPPDGYASPIYRDAQGDPIPVRNTGEHPPRLTLTEALAQSPNTAFVKLMERTGVPPVVDMAQRLGLTSLATTPATGEPDGPSVAEAAAAQNQASFTFGAAPTSALELANVMATLAGHGRWCPPNPVLSVTDRTGEQVELEHEPCRQAVDPEVADTLMRALGRDHEPGGTAAEAAAAEGWTRPAAGKTGTTQEHKSAAFAGATPQLAGASIVFDDSATPRPICGGDPPRSCADGDLFGGQAPARTWYRAMSGLLDGEPALPLPSPG